MSDSIRPTFAEQTLVPVNYCPRRHPPGAATTTPYVNASSSRRPPTLSATSSRRRPPALRQQRRRMSQTTATVPARPSPGLQPVARPRWCRLGCVSHDTAARPPRRSLIVARSRRRARTRRLGSKSKLPAGSAPTSKPRDATDVIGDFATRRRPPARGRLGCATARPRRLAGATSITSLRLAATPAPRHDVIERHHTRRPAGAAKTSRRRVGATTSTATTHRSSLHVNRQKSSTAPATFFLFRP